MRVKVNLGFNVKGKIFGPTAERPESFQEAFEKALAAPQGEGESAEVPLAASPGEAAEPPEGLPEQGSDTDTHRLFSVQALIVAALLSGVILAVCYLIRWVGQ